MALNFKLVRKHTDLDCKKGERRGAERDEPVTPPSYLQAKIKIEEVKIASKKAMRSKQEQNFYTATGSAIANNGMALIISQNAGQAPSSKTSSKYGLKDQQARPAGLVTYPKSILQKDYFLMQGRQIKRA